MCLLIVKPATERLKKVIFEHGDTNNPDGMGIAFVKDNTLVIEKGIWTYESFYTNCYKPVEAKECMIHFRAASPQMDVNEEMCHPFFVETNAKNWELADGTPGFQFAIAHNGRLKINPEKNESDTCTFVNKVLGPILQQNPYALTVPANTFLLEQYLDVGNKIAIMWLNRTTQKHGVFILNPFGGYVDRKAHFLGKIWFSNKSYEPEPKKTTYQVGAHSDYQLGYTEDAEWDRELRDSIADRKNTEDKNKEDSKSEKEEPDSLYESEFTIPDQAGWFWSTKSDCWKNKNTGASVPTLTNRKLPLYMQMRNHRLEQLEEKVAKDKAQALKDSPARLGSLGAINSLRRKLSNAESKDLMHDARHLDGTAFTAKWGERLLRSNEAAISTPGKDAKEASEDDLTEDYRLSHLTKVDRTKLRRWAKDWYIDEMGRPTSLTIFDVVKWARATYRKQYELPAKMTCEEVDREIVAEINAINEVDKQEAPNVINLEDEMAKAADAVPKV